MDRMDREREPPKGGTTCGHRSFKTVAAVTPREGFGFELRVHVSCLECGTPLRFGEQRPGLETHGLVAVLVGEASGD